MKLDFTYYHGFNDKATARINVELHCPFEEYQRYKDIFDKRLSTLPFEIPVEPGDRLHLDVFIDISKKLNVDTSVLQDIALKAIKDYLDHINN